MTAKHCAVFLVLLSLTSHVSSKNGATCAVSLSWPHPAVCNDVNSLRDIVDEIQPSWTNLKINNGVDRSFAVDALDTDNYEQLQRIETLDLGDIGQVSISRVGFRPFLQLLRLNLTSASLKSLKSDWFDENSSITHLDLSHNELSVIRRRDLRSLRKLNELNLAHNLIEEVETRAFSDVTHLRKLELRDNRLRTIEDMGELSDLKTLDLSENSITEISQSGVFKGLKALVSMTIAQNAIRSIPEGAFAGLDSLEHLNLSGNSIRQLSVNVFTNVQLKVLDLSRNGLIAIAGNTFKLVPNINFLSLAHNRLAKLDDNLLAPLKSLRTLHIHNNVITELSSTIMDETAKLVEFSFRRNRLTFLPATSASFDNMEKVSLEGNPWQCPCLFEFFELLSHRHVEYGTEQNSFYMGWNPICSVTNVNTCIRSTALAHREGVVSKYEAKVHLSPGDLE